MYSYSEALGIDSDGTEIDYEAEQEKELLARFGNQN
jgi:hypothetical protein